jgi:hypothetical protein
MSHWVGPAPARRRLRWPGSESGLPGFAEAPAQSALMLGFSGYPRQIIAPAIARLARAFER